MRRDKSWVWTWVLLLATLAMGFFVGKCTRGWGKTRGGGGRGMDKLEATLQLIDHNYVDSIDADQLLLDLIPTLMEQLDPHSSYLTAEERQKEKESMEGFFFGVGITFNTIKDTAVVVSVIPNGPSDLVGVRAGDRILSVDQQDIATANLPADSIRSLLRGPKGSVVKVTVKAFDSNDVRQISIRRGVVTMPQMDAAVMLSDSIGYIRFSSFTRSTYNEFMQSVAKLKQAGMEALILDLRDNAGGLLQPALMIANEFLPAQNLILYTEGAHAARQDVFSDGTGSLQHLPIYLLINGATASSAEIVTGAMQDNDRGIVLGQRSFGKGLVQQLFEYSDGSSLHLTIARYYTASGRCLQRPYDLGKGAEYYTNNLFERYSRGELFHADSIKIDPELLYKTMAGRSVYGGGGITPDIFIPQDTTGYTSYYGEVVQRGVLQRFAFEYADQHRILLERLEGAEPCYRFLSNQGLPWLLAEYARKRGIAPRHYLIQVSSELLNRAIIPQIVEYIYGAEEAWRVRTYTDPMVLRASQMIGEGILSPLNIPEEKCMIKEKMIE